MSDDNTIIHGLPDGSHCVVVLDGQGHATITRYLHDGTEVWSERFSTSPRVGVLVQIDRVVADMIRQPGAYHHQWDEEGQAG